MPAAAGPTVSLCCLAQLSPAETIKASKCSGLTGWFGPQGAVSLSMGQVRGAWVGR